MSMKREVFSILKKIKVGSTPLEPIKDLNIETTTYCNRTCRYCPNSVFERGSKKNRRQMPVSLFTNIIDELAEIDFSGRISPHLYGEPLTDSRLPSLMKYAHTKLPRAKLQIFTNGDLLTPELLSQLYEVGVRDYFITLHDADAHPHTRSTGRIEQLMTAASHHKMDVNLQYQTRSDMTLYNRGGLVKTNEKSPRPVCLEPDNPVAINYRGDVLICCNDYLGEVTFGNLQNESLWDIWAKPNFLRLRRQLRKRVYVSDICKRCTGT
jgi:2-deoxy-scyllo-inosamine dehydrogenase (SAM-dependent)